MLVWFGEGSTYRAKFEGEGEIRQALGTGRLNGVMKEFLDRRVKLKLAEHMAEELATHVRDEMSEREKRIRRYGLYLRKCASPTCSRRSYWGTFFCTSIFMSPHFTSYVHQSVWVAVLTIEKN